MNGLGWVVRSRIRIHSMDRLCPPSFVCPVNQTVMEDPVVCADGQSYDRSAIEEWLKDHRTSPVTNLPLPNLQLVPNHALRNSIQEWLLQTFKTVSREHVALGGQIGTGTGSGLRHGI